MTSLTNPITKKKRKTTCVWRVYDLFEDDYIVWQIENSINHKDKKLFFFLFYFSLENIVSIGFIIHIKIENLSGVTNKLCISILFYY